MRRNRLAAVALTFAATSTACVTTMAAAPAAHAGTATFYTAPASVPATPGTLIKSEPFFTGLGVYGKTTRIMYSTRDTNDKPTAVTGGRGCSPAGRVSNRISGAGTSVVFTSALHRSAMMQAGQSGLRALQT